MTYEFYADIDARQGHAHRGARHALAAGFVDDVTVWAHPDQKDAKGRRRDDQDKYREFASKLQLEPPALLRGEPAMSLSTWTRIDVQFILTSPWYSKDDRPFHVLDNPVRKDRVFGVPFMAAASWKGLLRWACRMEAGLLEHLERHDGRVKGWRDPDWIVHLFGNERGEGEEFSRGALQFFPTWFDRIGFEVINPHSREKRAGMQPIVYEVVPAGTQGRLTLLHAPHPGQNAPPGTVRRMLDAVQNLLTVYGFSAKRTAGWGLAEIEECALSVVRGSALDEAIGRVVNDAYEPPSETVARLLDDSGRPIEALWKDGALISKTQLRKLKDKKPCTSRELEEVRAWYSKHGDEHQRRVTCAAGADIPRVVKHDFDSIERLRAVFQKAIVEKEDT